MATQAGSLLATRRGRLTLLLLCAVQFLDIADSSIMNVALPSVRRHLGFSVQGLQWVLSGYLLTYGGFLLLGGRAADATQMIAFAGFVSLFLFLTLYMQNVLGYSPIQGGSACLPVTAGIVAAAGISSRLFARIGTRPVTVAGALIAAAAIFDLSRVPVHGSYLTDLLPGLVVMSIGLGAVFVSVTAAANAGVPRTKPGWRPGLLNTSQQLGTALGLAVFSAIATARTSALLAAHTPRADALTAGFHQALLACAIFLLAAAGIAVRATNTHGEPTAQPAQLPEGHGPMARPELTDQDQPTPAHTPQQTQPR